ncbi:MAG: hypothetical protein ISS45_09265 [Candidatus Omnitrophica bacterium]|nr:hypothetical protein [Candidatus Omnitrophota bacterium]
MKGIFEANRGKRRILRILTVFAVATLGITGHLKGVEGAIGGGNWPGEGKVLTESEAEEVRAIWRVIAGQEIVTWDGKEWLAKTENQKREAIKKVCEAWKKAGYQKIESVEYFVEDVDKYYNHHGKKDPEEGLKEKVGLVVSLSAFFAGMGEKLKD